MIGRVGSAPCFRHRNMIGAHSLALEDHSSLQSFCTPMLTPVQSLYLNSPESRRPVPSFRFLAARRTTALSGVRTSTRVPSQLHGEHLSPPRDRVSPIRRCGATISPDAYRGPPASRSACHCMAQIQGTRSEGRHVRLLPWFIRSRLVLPFLPSFCVSLRLHFSVWVETQQSFFRKILISEAEHRMRRFLVSNKHPRLLSAPGEL